MGNKQTTETLGANNTGEDVLRQCGTALIAGKKVLITGGTGGLGYESARALAGAGATVVITSRTGEMGQKAIEKLKDELKDKKDKPINVSFEILDLGDLVSVKECAGRLLKKGEPIHILMNNAGVMACPHTKTKQGLEFQFGVNHVGHHLLTKLLLPLLTKAGTAQCKSRVINLSSMGAYLYAPPDAVFWDDISGDKSYNKWQRYGQSKLCNVLFSRELN